MLGWLIAIVLAVLVIGMLALDISPRDVFRAGWDKLTYWYLMWRNH